MIRIHISLERWRYSIGLLTTTTLITQLLTPQPEPSIVNDPEQQADFWRDKTEAKTQENEELIEMNAELEQAIEELEKEVERLNGDLVDRNIPSDTSDVSADSPNTVDISNKSMEVEATAYVSTCEGCSGITASGYDVRSTIYTPEGLRVLAAPPSIPFHTKMRVTLSDGSSFIGEVLDRGGAITEGKLDILVESRAEAYRLGRQSAKVEVIE